MGYSENTSYIATDFCNGVASALKTLCAAEGMRLVDRPPPRERMGFEPMQQEDALRNNLWAVAVFPGARGWTVIKTAPLELLAEKAPGHGEMRFAELCRAVAAPGFQLNVYETTGAVLVECDGEGRTLLSGMGFGSKHPDMTFNGEPLSEDRLELRFDVLPLQEHLDRCKRSLRAMAEELEKLGVPAPDVPGDIIDNEVMAYDEVARSLARALGGRNAEHCDNLTSVETLVSHQPVQAGSAVELYFEWPARDRPEPPRRPAL